MLIGCRHVCLAWAAIGLLTLITGIAANLGDLARVGAFVLVAFGAVRLAMASDEFGGVGRWLAACAAGTPLGPEPPTARGFWSRPSPYVLLPLPGFVVLVGRALLRPPLGDDGRVLLLGVMAGALTLTVVYLSLLAAEAAEPVRALPPTGAASPKLRGPAAPPPAAERIRDVGPLDTTQFARNVLSDEPTGEPTRP